MKKIIGLRIATRVEMPVELWENESVIEVNDGTEINDLDYIDRKGDKVIVDIFTVADADCDDTPNRRDDIKKNFTEWSETITTEFYIDGYRLPIIHSRLDDFNTEND